MIPINKPQLDERERQEVIKVLDDAALTSAAMEGGKYVCEFERLLKGFLNVKLDIEKKITRCTKAIVPVHLYGHPASMNEISEIAARHSLAVIEDACQSLGSSYFGRQTGGLGNMGCFSMYASKVITSGEGGAIATNDDYLANELMMVRNHGMVKGYDTKVLGLNMRLPEISAAIARVQLEKLTDILDLRRRNALILHDLKGSRYNWYLYTVTLDNKRDEIKSNLHENGIGAMVYYDPPVHMTPYYSKHYPNSNLKFTELASKSVLSLPVHQSLSEEEAKFIANKVIEIMQE